MHLSTFSFVFQIFSFDCHAQVVFSAVSMQKKCLNCSPWEVFMLKKIVQKCDSVYCTVLIWINFWADRKWQKLRAGTWQPGSPRQYLGWKIEGKCSQIINDGTFAHRSTYYLFYACTPHWIVRRAVSNSYCWWSFASKENTPPPPPPAAAHRR